MATTCSPDSLAESVACLDKQDQQTLLAQIVWLLCQLNSMSCDPDALAEIDAIKCLQNWDQQSLLAAAVYQLCVISGGGGIGPPPLGAAPEIYQDVFANPNGNISPNNPNQPARYSQLASAGGTGTEFHWQKDSHVWI